MKTLRILALLAIGAAACAATTATLAPMAKISRPTLVLRASRLIALPQQPITLTAELVGGDDAEATYCPAVVWTWPDGTESGAESDCPPFAPGVEYTRRWTKHGSLAAPGLYTFTVRLEKPIGHVIARSSLVLTAAGGE